LPLGDPEDLWEAAMKRRDLNSVIQKVIYGDLMMGRSWGFKFLVDGLRIPRKHFIGRLIRGYYSGIS
jgi:hypothetical protein